MKRDVVIGIEIHCELKSKAKMFSDAPITFNADVNSFANEIDVGYPGTLPSLNQEAVRLSLMACLITDCEIDRLMRFDRKNYFYSDLPKGYQITQQFYPIGKNGKVTIDVENQIKVIGIERIHMEEDTAKQFHEDDGTLIDYNRAGNPLIEIVSKPEIHSAKEARAYVETLQNMLLYAGISDVKMEAGSLRCDVNVSLKDKGSNVLGTKVEIKNLNSIANIERAIDVEIKRQNEILNRNETVISQTRRFDESLRTTVLMRDKDDVVDYRYFPEPNILPTIIDDGLYEQAKQAIPLMPAQKLEQLIDEYQLKAVDAKILINNKPLLDYFDQIMKHSKHPIQVGNALISEVLALDVKEDYHKVIEPEAFADYIDLIVSNTINSKQAKTVFEHMLKQEKPKQIIKDLDMSVVSDAGALLAWVLEAIENNPQSVVDFKNGKDRAVGFLVGQVMKLSKGKADPKIANQLVRAELMKK